MIDRRTFLVVLSAAALHGQRTFAQEGKIPRIAYVSNSTPNDYRVRLWRKGLSDLGYAEGENIEIEYFYYDKFDELPEVVPEVLASQPDIIMSLFTPTTLAFKDAATSIPIVFSNVADPVGSGIVENLANPGSNITGLTIMTADIAGKRLAVLAELVPDAKRIAAFFNPGNAAGKPQLAVALDASKTLGVDLRPVEARGSDDWDALLDGLVAEGVQGLFFVTDQTFTNNSDRIAAAALKHRLPTIFDNRKQIVSGGLAAYGPDYDDHFVRSAHRLHRIIKGEQPGKLPIEQPTKFRLMINLKTASALGISVSPNLMIQATELIE